MRHARFPVLGVLMFAVCAVAGVVAESQARAGAPAGYAIENTAVRATVGVPGKAPLGVVGKDGWHLNEDAPITLTLIPDGAITLPKSKFARTDLAISSKEKARFDVAFTPTAAGKFFVAAEMRFVLCAADACKPTKELLKIELNVEPAPVAIAAPVPTKVRPAKKRAPRKTAAKPATKTVKKTSL